MTTASEIARFYGQGREVKSSGGFLTFCPCHDNTNTPSLSIKDSKDGGVDVYCHGAGCDFKDIKDRFRQDGLLPEWKPERSHKQHGNSTKRMENQPCPVQHTQEPQPESEKESRIWKRSSRDNLDHAKQYLAGRGITIDLPICIRWNTYTDRKTGELTNIIVAAVSKHTDTAVYAIQRLFIDIETHKKTGAKMHGKCEGRGVWFNRKGDLTTVMIGEGIENTMSVMQATGNNSGVAALSWSGIKNLIVPDSTETIYLLVDSDPVKDDKSISLVGQKASYIAAKQFIESRDGRQAFLVSPDDTCFSDNPNKIDFNDLLKADPSGASIRSRFEKAIEIRALQWTPPVNTKQSDEDLNDPDQEREIFERFVFLAPENKIIDTVGHDIKDSMMIERAFIISQAGKLHRYIDANGDMQVIPLAKHWIMSEKKKVASGLKYQPGESRLFENGDGRNYYNVFRFPFEHCPPMPIMERTERLKPYDEIMNQVFHKHRSYIEDWLSFTLQHPSKRAGIMPVCISNVGLGKSMVMGIIARVVGFHNFTNAKILDVTGLGKSGAQWGDWIFNKKISCIEEIDPEGDSSISYQVVDALKDIITNETLPLNLKGGRNGTFQIFSNIMGFSNHPNCMKIPLGDRRIFVVDSTGQENLTKQQYDYLLDWMAIEPNIIAVYQYLIERKISDEFCPGQAKMTKAKMALQLDSRSTLQTAFDLVIEQFPCDLVTNGELMLAVSEAMVYIDGGDITDYPIARWKTDKQYQAILKSTTTLVAEGKRFRVHRVNGGKSEPGRVRAIRNRQKWASASVQDIKAAMCIAIPWQWTKEEDNDDEVPF